MPWNPKGYVYFIEAPSVHRIKIGWAHGDLRVRLSGLQVGSPVPLVILAYMRALFEREAELHRRFASLREIGEWFRDDPLLRRYIEKHAKAFREDDNPWVKPVILKQRGLLEQAAPVAEGLSEEAQKLHEARVAEAALALTYDHSRLRRLANGSKIK
jgi:hypothetical protein